MGKLQNKIKYHRDLFDPDKLEKENIDRMGVDRVKSNSYVLDIGCATGAIGEYLEKKKQCKVVGLNISKDEAVIARKRISGIIVGDIENKQFLDKLIKYTVKEKFDVILMMSIIEHLKNPDLVIRKIPQLLKKNGIIIVTTPNIAHWSMRISLLKGNFNYEQYGILDNTHLRFFTEATFRELFGRNDFNIKDYAIDSVGGGRPRISRFLSRFFPKIFAYQMLIVASAAKK